MTAFCTYCSASKSHDSGSLPAIRRYRSKRIDSIYAAARSADVRFFILSGEFGLVEPDSCIPDYDHKLTAEEVTILAERVASQIQGQGITDIVYFTAPLGRNTGVVPYKDTVVRACSRSGCAFRIVELGGHEMSKWKDIMNAADDAKLEMVSDRRAGEKTFELLLRQNPRDGMIYFKRGEVYEAIGERVLAASDFQKALALFPQADWKERAKAALARVA